MNSEQPVADNPSNVWLAAMFAGAAQECLDEGQDEEQLIKLALFQAFSGNFSLDNLVRLRAQRSAISARNLRLSE